MDSRLEAHLIACLSQLEQGAPLEEILAPYPADTAANLRPMLLTAVRLRQLPLAHTVAAQADSKKRFVAEAAVLRDKRPSWGQGWLINLWGGLRLTTAVALFALIFFAGYIFLNAPNALPGDQLYGAKLTLENWTLSRQPADVRQAEIQAERRREVAALLVVGRSTAVAFQGELAASDLEFWLVGEIPVIITTDTRLDGPLDIGAVVEISGQTADGRVWARQVTLLQPAPAPPPPQPPPTPTPTPPAEPTETQLKPTATPTAVVTPTLALTPVLPSPTAVSDDNRNDNNNDNGDDDDDDNYNDNDDDDD
jgi:hypothetical protein